MDGNYDDVAISTFKSGLPIEHGLRKSLTGKPVTSVRQLMDRIDKTKGWKRISCKEKEMRRLSHKEGLILGRTDTTITIQGEISQDNPSRPIHRQLTLYSENQYSKFWKKVKNEPFFKWLNKMAEDSMKQNKSLYCQYHQDHRHTTEDCRNLWNHLDQLVRERKLRHLLHPSSGYQGQVSQEPRRDTSLRPPIGTINVIFAAPGKTGSCPTRVMSVDQLPACDFTPEPKRPKVYRHPILDFSEEDKFGTIQPHETRW